MEPREPFGHSFHTPDRPFLTLHMGGGGLSCVFGASSAMRHTMRKHPNRGGERGRERNLLVSRSEFELKCHWYCIHSLGKGVGESSWKLQGVCTAYSSWESSWKIHSTGIVQEYFLHVDRLPVYSRKIHSHGRSWRAWSPHGRFRDPDRWIRMSDPVSDPI